MFGVRIPGIPGQGRGFKKPRVILLMADSGSWQQKLMVRWMWIDQQIPEIKNKWVILNMVSCVYIFVCIIYAYNKPIGIWNWMGNQSVIIEHQWWSMPIDICLFTTVNQNGQTVNHSFFVSTQNQRSHDLGMYWTFRLWGHNESLLLAWFFSPMPRALTWVGQLRPLAPTSGGSVPDTWVFPQSCA